MDAVIIGAGHNGLVAANLLADAGWEVLVLEATGSLGGSVRSAEISPGYLSDLCSAFFPMGAVSPVLRRLGLDAWGLRWRHAPDVLGHLLPDGRAVVLNRDPHRTAASVEEFAPGDGHRWLAAYAQWQRESGPLLAALFSPFPPVRAGLGLVRNLRTAGALRLARRALLPARELGAEFFRGEGAQLLLAGCAQHTDLGPDDASSGIYGWLMAMLGQQVGFPVPVGGAQRITDALVSRLHSRGGRVAYRVVVDRIVTAHGRALGVTATDGRSWRARRAVLADVPAPTLFLDLLDPRQLPPRMRDDLEHFHWDGSTVKLDWALSEPVPWHNDAVAGAGTIHLGGDLNGLAHYTTALACGEVPSQPFVLVGQMSTADPERSPAGTESLWAYTHLPHRQQWSADEVAAHVDRIERTIDLYAPGYAKYVVARHVAGPVELALDNPSLVGGAIAGGSAAAHQQLFLRPVPGLGRADTPVDRLYLASASAHPGGGVHGAPGANAARAALLRNRPAAGSLYAAATAAAMRAVYR